MNTEEHLESVEPEPTATGLPTLTDDRIEAIESSLFAEISRASTARRKRRTGVWILSGAAAAAIVVAAVIAPSVGTLVGVAVTYESAVAPSAPLVDSGAGSAVDSSVTGGEMMAPEGGDRAAGAADDAAGTTARDIITTASATVVVDDIPTAVALIADAAESRDGYVESMSIGTSGQVMPVDPMTGTTYGSTMPYPSTPDGAWITVRVPADGLQSLVDQLSGLGEVTASTINRQDVTEVTLDLEARVSAAQASVDRLEALMAQAGSLTDLIAAESALAERQATLESYQQQLKYYDEQVAMSTLTVSVTEPVETVEANPAGFGDGLTAGWNGLVATLNGIVIALGFLIPWIAVLAVAGLIVWGIVALVSRRRKSSAAPSTARAADSPADDSPKSS